jgi:hypothetical protein
MRRLSACLLFSACTPATTRPFFQPYPQALTAILNARPARVIGVLDSLVAADSVAVIVASPQDGYLETAWYDTAAKASRTTHGDVPNLATTVKIRCWADPYVPGESTVTLEPVYRPRYDASRTERDLEVVVPPEHDGYKIAERWLGKLKERLGAVRPSGHAPSSPSPPDRSSRPGRGRWRAAS